MKRYNPILVFVMLAIVILITSQALSQVQETAQAKAPQTPVSEEKKATEPTEISLYGDVQAVNVSTNSLTVQYYDYDSDEEKIIELVFNKDTKIENAPSLNDIKQGDWVDVTYSVVEGKNILKSVVVEKETELPAEATPEEGAGEAGE
jgi:Cu/Ag efflux protein CusF